MNSLETKEIPTQTRDTFSVNSSFVAVAHDLKNPISAVFGYTDILLETPIGEGLTTVQRDIVMRMRDAALRTLDLVKNYAQLSSMEYEAIKPSAFAVDINAMVDIVVHSTWRESKDGPKLSLNLSPFPLLLHVERVHLDRIFTNLLSNALKYTPKTGAIEVRTRGEGPMCVLEVLNSGVHIPEVEQKKVFNRFTRGKNSIGTSGSGLGLFIVQTLVASLGGSVSLESSANNSFTLFTIKLPLAKTPESDLETILD